MNKKIIMLAILSFGLFLVLLGVGITKYIDYKINAVESNNTTETTEENTQVESVPETEENIQQEMNPFGNRMGKEELAESDILNYIHWMSHQKVKAADKWGFYEITDERIDWLLSIVDQMGRTEYREGYREILKKWKNNDFSEIDDDHNFVWGILGGTKDEQKAKGILSETEEQEYIENTKEVYELYEDQQ